MARAGDNLVLGVRNQRGGARAAFQRVVEFAVHDQRRAFISGQAIGEVRDCQRVKYLRERFRIATGRPVEWIAEEDRFVVRLPLVKETGEQESKSVLLT